MKNRQGEKEKQRTRGRATTDQKMTARQNKMVGGLEERLNVSSILDDAQVSTLVTRQA